MELYIVDAFTDCPFGGNPAGVVIMDRILDDAIMQKISAEIRYSETAFVSQSGTDDFTIRFFTPNSEVDLCGHATISSFQVLKEKNMVKSGNVYNMKAKAGLLPIYVYEDSIMMEQAEPKFRTEYIDLRLIADIMGINQEDIGDRINDINPQIVSTGLWDIMLPVKSDMILNSIEPDFNRLAEFSKELNVVGLHAFTLDSNDHTANCRNFAPLYDINEEAATGSSNGALTCYLYRNGIIEENNKNTFLQGERMGRPSVITTRIENKNGTRVLVGGSSRIIARGELLV